jgi:hypothetical protein
MKNGQKSEHSDRPSNARKDLEDKYLGRFEDLKSEYPEHAEFFDENKAKLLLQMNNIKSEGELKFISTHIEVAYSGTEFPYASFSSSFRATEDTLLDLLDRYRTSSRKASFVSI